MAIYLDYNAGAPLRPEVWAAMSAAAVAGLGNPSSTHAVGRGTRAALEEARASVGLLLGAPAAEVVFTSGGTEANNLALRGLCGPGRNGAPRGGHIVTTAVEHASVLETCAALARAGWEVTSVGVDDCGRVDPGAIAAALREDTVVVSVGLANGEVGTIQPVREIAAQTGARGIPLHVDAVQAAGKIPIDVRALAADLVAVSGHKLGGPHGIGALYVSNRLRPLPLLTGGPQERGRRAGTENVLGAVGFGAAARLAVMDLPVEAQRQAALVDRLWAHICRAVLDTRRNGPAIGGVPNTLNVTFQGADADALVIGLDLCGIAVSAGSACAAGALEPSHVLLAMGREPADARAALRISVGHGTTAADVDALAVALPAVVERSRRAGCTREARA